MTETTRRRITTTAKITGRIIRTVTLALTLVVLVVGAAVALVFHLSRHDTKAQQAKATETLVVAWSAVLATARALRTW